MRYKSKLKIQDPCHPFIMQDHMSLFYCTGNARSKKRAFITSLIKSVWPKCIPWLHYHQTADCIWEVFLRNAQYYRAAKQRGIGQIRLMITKPKISQYNITLVTDHCQGWRHSLHQVPSFLAVGCLCPQKLPVSWTDFCKKSFQTRSWGIRFEMGTH